jgi:hypothetical protein
MAVAGGNIPFNRGIYVQAEKVAQERRRDLRSEVHKACVSTAPGHNPDFVQTLRKSPNVDSSGIEVPGEQKYGAIISLCTQFRAP